MGNNEGDLNDGYSVSDFSKGAELVLTMFRAYSLVRMIQRELAFANFNPVFRYSTLKAPMELKKNVHKLG